PTAQSWRDESIKIKDDAIWIHADSSYFGGFHSAGYSLVDIIRDILNPSSLDISAILEEKKRNNVCRECGEPFSSHLQWCKCCNSQHFKTDFGNWTSNNSVIDTFLQYTQITALDAANALEWINYNRFINVTPIGQGGYGTIHMAYFLDGDIRRWDHKNDQWERYPGFSVALKTLHSSQNLSVEFLNEAGELTNIVAIYGITQNPYTKEFVMVMEYMNKGNMRDYLRNNPNLNRLKIVLEISAGLMNIHTHGLVHGDLHSGNILFEDTSGGTAFIAHDAVLLIDVLKGKRPPLPTNVPKCYTNLIKKCWDPDPNNRPCAEEIQNTVKNWYYEKSQLKFSDFSDFLYTDKEFKNIREHNFTTHPNAVYTSRSL
ncbi:17953_t:CDS:2, partial [Racocetra persica]